MFLANFSGDPSRPSFFEMIAQQEMMPTLRPALRYAFNILSTRYPRLEWTSRFSDEIFYLMLLMLEKHHLAHYDASFSENFYGLKRVRATETVHRNHTRTTEIFPMTDSSRRWALILLVVVPYFKNKCDELYKELVPTYSFSIVDANSFSDSSEEQTPAELPFHKRTLQIFKKLFIKVYPTFNAFYEGAFFLYQLLYLYERISYFTPFLHLQNLTLRRLSEQEMQSQDKTKLESRKKRLRNLYGGPLLQLYKLVVLAYDAGLDYSKKLLPISIFAFRFLEWWYSPSNTYGQTALPIPPPPEPPKVLNKQLSIPADKEICAICDTRRTNPAMASSGYVYCYPCIFNYVQDNHKCPVTFIPMETDQIRKLYEAT